MEYSITGADTRKKKLWLEESTVALTGGFKISTTELKSGTLFLDQGTLVNYDIPTRTAKIVKTAIIITGGTTSAPRVAKTHQFVVGDFVSNGYVATAITAITTTHADYDTLTLTAALVGLATGDVIYQGASETTGGKVAASATVEEASTKELAITVLGSPINGVSLTLEQNSSDALAVAYASGVLSIKLADTTAGSNTAAAIQAAIRALGVIDGVDLVLAVATGTNWATITGGTITVGQDYFVGGSDYTDAAELRTANGFLRADIKWNTGATPDGNVIIGARELIEENFPRGIHAKNKTSLTDRFHWIAYS